jgi:DNA-binding NtrC family response regulator
MNHQGLYYVKTRAFQRELIESVLRLHRNDTSKTARALGLNRTYLYYLMRILEVERPVSR